MTDTMLFGVLKMPFEMAMSDEISRTQFYARVQELVGRFEAQQQAEPVSQAVIVGALFDFMGWLTTRKERLILSSTNNASPAVESITEFAKMRGLSLADARVQDWQNYTTQQQVEPTCSDCKAAVLYECVACSSNNYPPKQQAEPVQEPYESPYNPNPVEYQYHYPDGSWSCSNGEVINGMHPDRARSLYALKDNT